MTGSAQPIRSATGPEGRLASLAGNEARAMLPIVAIGVLAATVAAVVGGALTPGQSLPGLRSIRALALVASLGAMLGLGAYAVGHDYTHRTLGFMLMLPLDRRQLLGTKLAVLAAMVLPLAGYLHLLGVFREVPALPWLGAGTALCLAPALTMLCRSALAGAVFGGAVPGTVLCLIMMATTRWDASVEAERAARVTWAWLMIPLLAGAGILGWRRFMQLEWAEDAGREIHIGWPSRTASDGRASHPLWLLVKKELHLQRMAFALTALYLGGHAIWMVAYGWPDGDASAAALQAAASIYWLGLPILVGSLAIAEERQLGTLAWQLQLPIPVWQQRAVKSGTVCTLALLLGLGVPLLFAQIYGPAERPNVGLVILISTVTTAASLYVSSLCTVTVRAALASLATIPLGLWLVVSTAIMLRGAPVAFWSGREFGWLALVILAVALLMGFAFVNHRPEPPVASRIRRQALAIATLIGVGLLTLEATAF